jgi:O-antigen/teichoic acid export membrane protein
LSKSHETKRLLKMILNKFYQTFGIKSGRDKNIVKNIGWSSFYKIGSIISNFMLVPLTINYLDTENYGIWLTLTSFISWFSFFDIGLVNGLRNKFAEASAWEL